MHIFKYILNTVLNLPKPNLLTITIHSTFGWIQALLLMSKCEELNVRHFIFMLIILVEIHPDAYKHPSATVYGDGKTNTVSYGNEQLYGCQKTLKQTRYKALMVSPLLFVTKHSSNAFIIGLWLLACKRTHSNASKLCVLANRFGGGVFRVFPVASLKSKLSLSHELVLFLCGHGGNICRYTKPAFILITFTCSNSLRDARVHPVSCSIFIHHLTNLLWMVLKTNWFFFFCPQMWLYIL